MRLCWETSCGFPTSLRFSVLGTNPLESHPIMPAQVWSKDSVDYPHLYGGASTRGLASCLHS